ncbi:MAG: hypothetical protein GQ541_03890 [Desulfovibrionaceae bacterium]|nr:hypothetical protein [Desulfovibrionaceae bacterium]
MVFLKKKRRNRKRLKVKTGIAKTPAGVCQITNLTPDGLSFRCYKKLSFTREWSLDIYDTSGLSLEQLQVRKIWQNSLSNLDASSKFSMTVGVAFRDLSPSQKEQLNSYIQQLQGIQE